MSMSYGGVGSSVASGGSPSVSSSNTDGASGSSGGSRKTNNHDDFGGGNDDNDHGGGNSHSSTSKENSHNQQDSFAGYNSVWSSGPTLTGPGSHSFQDHDNSGSGESSRSGSSSRYGGIGSSAASGGTDAKPSNANDNTADGPNGGNPDDAFGVTDAGTPRNARDNTADGPNGGDPNGWPNNGEKFNTADGPLGGDPNAFENLTGTASGWSPADAYESTPFSTMAGMFFDWATGTGPTNRQFVDDPVARSLQDAPIMNEARDFWYDKVRNGSENTSGYGGPGSSEAAGGTDSITIESGVTDFKGTRRLGGGNFGPVGAWNAGTDPVEQVIGSYGVEIESDGETLTFSATNTTSMESFLYGIGPEYERIQFGPGGNLRQTYQFSEPIDVARLDNGASATNNTSDGPNGGDPNNFDTLTNTNSNWSASEPGFFQSLLDKIRN